MVDKSTILQIIGCLMKHPQYLSETDKYSLTPDDFYYRFDKYIFIAIDSLYRAGAQRIQPIDVENYLSTNEKAKLIFKQNNGIEYLQDADYLSEVNNFSYYYNKLKKFNLLETFKEKGIDTSEFYKENALSQKDLDINAQFETLEIEDIIDQLKKKLLGVERQFIKNDSTEVSNAFEGIEDILEKAQIQADVGIPLQGTIFNEVIAGARRGTFVLRSAASGTGKTRTAVADACFLAFPFRYDSYTGKWVQEGNNEKVLVITTEQTAEEIQKMILAYLTDMNETKFRYGGFTDNEMKIIEKALWILETYQDNFHIVRMPSPSIGLLKNLVRETVLLYDIGYVFFDYIHLTPSLLNEFKGSNLRNDEVLLLVSEALKNLAVELNVFVMSSTQLNAKGDESGDIKNERALAGSRAIINKADIGCIISRPTKEELDFFENEEGRVHIPNIVCDIYKVRAGEWVNCRIWSDMNLGTLRKQDLFITDARLNPVNYTTQYTYVTSWEGEEALRLKDELDYLNEKKE